MMLTTHGLFLTCTQSSIFIFTEHIINLWAILPCTNVKGKPTNLEGWCFTHGGESPSTLVPCLVAQTHPLLSDPPSPPSHPFDHIMLLWRHQQLQFLRPEQGCYSSVRTRGPECLVRVLLARRLITLHPNLLESVKDYCTIFWIILLGSRIHFFMYISLCLRYLGGT